MMLSYVPTNVVTKATSTRLLSIRRECTYGQLLRERSGIDDGNSQCFCGNTINPIANKTDGLPTSTSTGCSYTCPGNSTEKCGGTYFMNLYEISNPNPNPPPLNPKRSPVCQTNPFCANKACDTSLSQSERIAALLAEMSVVEKAQNMVDSAAGVPRLGLPSYEYV